MNKEKCNHLDKLAGTVLQVLPSLETGGVENGTIELAIALHKEGFKPLVASRGGKLVKLLDQYEIPHIRLPLHSKNPVQMVLNVRRLLAVIKMYHVNVVHVRSRAPAWSARLACKLAKIPLVTTFHGTYNFHNHIKKLYNSIMVRGQRIIAVSDFIKSHILEHYARHTNAEKIVVIQRGIDLKKYDRSSIKPDRSEAMKNRWGVDARIPLILMPARLTRWKGQTILIKALSILKSKGFLFRCILAGSSQGRKEYVQELQGLIQADDLGKDIHIDEHCPDLPAGYALADMVIHASTDPEAFGRVIVEAQAMRVPVIASNIGAPREIIVDRETGWLHKAGNAEDLAQKIQEVLELSEQQKARIVKQAMAKVKKEYSNQLMFQRTIAVYAELLYSSDFKNSGRRPSGEPEERILNT
jgi:glycosyltransferase involved in cell wall biosynthesis